jgi:DNA-damage-inducible protein J
MVETTNLSIRIDRNLKDEAEKVFGALGMNLTTAITVFVRQAVRQKKIPFEIALYPENENKIVSMREAMAASERIWQNSMQNGTNELTLDEINAEIAASRAEKKSSKVNV